MRDRQPCGPEDTEGIDDNPRKMVRVQQDSREEQQQERVG